jgi:GTP-binding protein HflX
MRSRRRLRVGRQRSYPQTASELLDARDRAVLVGADLGRADWPVEESLAELERLADTAGIEVAATTVQRLEKPNPRTFIGSGKAEEVSLTAQRLKANTVIFDDDLTPSQQASLEDLLPDTTVLDRTALILDIFGQHAKSREGKLQVDLARLEYVLPRLKGMWGHLEAERLGGGRGARFGAGESQLETDRRLTRRRIADLRRELKLVSTERELQRKRRAGSGVFRVALVGYTNAGKSTLLNALTDAGVLTQDKLFATLDSTTRRLELPEGREVTLTDTVGFINKLPHGLVEAFKSTLDEVAEADLLLHVTDAAAPQREAQMRAVREVLDEIGAQTTPGVIVLNKSDLLDADDRAALAHRHSGSVVVSAATGDGIDALVARIAEEAARGSVTLSLLIPYTRGDLVQLAHERTQILSEVHAETGTELVVRVPSEIASRFDGYLADSQSTQPKADR